MEETGANPIEGDGFRRVGGDLRAFRAGAASRSRPRGLGGGWNRRLHEMTTAAPRARVPRSRSGEGVPNSGREGETPRWPHLWIVLAIRLQNARLPRPRRDGCASRASSSSRSIFSAGFWSAIRFSSTPCGFRRTTWPPRASMRRALQIDRRLVRLIPDDAIAWYNLACSYTVLGMIDPGFFALQRALELGYATPAAASRPGSQGPAPRSAVRSAAPAVRVPGLNESVRAASGARSARA